MKSVWLEEYQITHSHGAAPKTTELPLNAGMLVPSAEPGHWTSEHLMLLLYKDRYRQLDSTHCLHPQVAELHMQVLVGAPDGHVLGHMPDIATVEPGKVSFWFLLLEVRLQDGKCSKD